MSVAFPWVLWGMAAAVAALVAAHLLSVTRPRSFRLPTARFVPARTLRAVSMASRPSEMLLLFVRSLILVTIGIALAGVSWSGARESVATLLVIDSGTVAGADSAELRMSAARAVDEFGAPSAIVIGSSVVQVSDRSAVMRVMDSLQRIVRVSDLHDSASASASASADANVSANASANANANAAAITRQSLAASLLSARRIAPSIAASADSVRLVLLSTLREDITHDALRPVRATWPGRFDVVRVAERSLDSAHRENRTEQEARSLNPSVSVRASGDDIVAAAFARWSPATPVAARVLRDHIGPDDSLAASGGEVVVSWVKPHALSGSSSASRPDSGSVAQVSALAASGSVLTAPFIPHASTTGTSRADARPVVWWADGAPAATEQRVGEGCIRQVGFEPVEGDALLSIDARGILSALVAECGGTGASGSPPLLDSASLALLSGQGPLASRGALTSLLPTQVSPLTRWLLVAALLLLAVETVLRSRTHARETSERENGSSAQPRVVQSEAAA